MKTLFKPIFACAICALSHVDLLTAQEPAARPNPNLPTEIKLSVSPAPEPQPALKYSLAIGTRERKPGNAVPFYHRALLSQRGIPEAHHKKFNEKERQWFEQPLTAQDREDIKQYLSSFGTTFRELEVAVYREYCDWDFRIQDLKGMDAISFLLPEIQDARSLARVLRLKARLEIAEGRYDEAVETLRWGYQLAQDAGRPPLLICNLVGIAISAVMTEPLVELMEAPNAPNMYWAIAALPQPLVDVRKALEFERGFPEQIFPFLKDAETVDRSPQEWQRILEQSVADFDKVSSEQLAIATLPQWMQRAGLVLMIAKVYPQAKAELVASGMDAERVEKMSVAQVVAVQTARHTRQSYDDSFKAMLLPYPESLRVATKIEELNRKRRSSTVFLGREGLPIATLLLPGTLAVKRAEIRGPRQFAVLQVVEAIRMHAAKTGELPETLSEISVVSVPVNPVTREPFPYRLTDAGALLEMPTLSEETLKSLAKKYTITLRK